ncbi:MAG: TonB-dependent receptor plug domain-containing protein [Bacteroidales bacterium]|nr:TonB-dependent receptor plug domain-containing protein [Bacteroidales bacterium]
MKRKDITSSVSSLQVNEKEVTTYTNMYDYLRGRVSGVQVTSDNRILIRGINSINLSTDPLIILDGAEITDLSVINPNDVESVTVLKDGSASIYGVRGANGVIIITTRR